MFNQYPYINVNDLNLDYIIKHFKEIFDRITALEEWRTAHEAEYAELKGFMDAINAGDFPQSMINALYQWMFDNALDLVGEMVKHVFFEVSDSGYFVVNIPQNWRNLIFKTTGLDIELALQPEYGHLCILY